METKQDTATCECSGWEPDAAHYMRTGDSTHWFGCLVCRNNCDGAPDGHHGRCLATPTVETDRGWLCANCAVAERVPSAAK